jgi:hypothetical protein
MPLGGLPVSDTVQPTCEVDIKEPRNGSADLGDESLQTSGPRLVVMLVRDQIFGDVQVVEQTRNPRIDRQQEWRVSWHAAFMSDAECQNTATATEEHPDETNDPQRQTGFAESTRDTRIALQEPRSRLFDRHMSLEAESICANMTRDTRTTLNS